MQALYRQQDNVKALGWLRSLYVSVSVYAPAEIYCNVSGEASGGL